MPTVTGNILELEEHPCIRDVCFLMAYPEKAQISLSPIPCLGLDSFCSIFWETVGGEWLLFLRLRYKYKFFTFFYGLLIRSNMRKDRRFSPRYLSPERTEWATVKKNIILFFFSFFLTTWMKTVLSWRALTALTTASLASSLVSATDTQKKCLLNEQMSELVFRCLVVE